MRRSRLPVEDGESRRTGLLRFTLAAIGGVVAVSLLVLAAWVGPFQRSLMRQMSRIHVWLYRKTGGRFVSMGGTVLILTTIGARSGAERSVPVAGYRHGDGWILVAAAGRDHHPGWYHNLLAHPDVVVERSGATHRMVARETRGAERAALWDKVVEVESGFASMQLKSERVFPVIVLEPRDTAARQTV